jgi:hypothetical protein
LREEENDHSSPTLRYFHTWVFDFHTCSGSSEIGGPHIEVIQPRRHQEQILNSKLHSKHKGSIANYFSHLISITQDPIPAVSCWRVKDGLPLCSGHRTDIKNILISLPMVLTFEIELTSRPSSWDFPEKLYPLVPEPKASELGLIYDLVGLVLFSKSKSHFIARYASPDQATIYTYDAMANGGFPIIETKADFSTHVAGKKIALPKGYSVYQAFYNLHGGRQAQQIFYDQRTQALSDKHHLKFVPSITSQFPPRILYQSETLSKLDPESRLLWTKKPETWGIEYVSKNAIPVEEAATEVAADAEVESEASSSSKEGSHSPSPVLSLPDSLFPINCRCGMVSDGNIHYRQEDGEVIQCDNCAEWSHIACQKNGRASNLETDKKFFCDFCHPNHVHDGSTRASERQYVICF